MCASRLRLAPSHRPALAGSHSAELAACGTASPLLRLAPMSFAVAAPSAWAFRRSQSSRRAPSLIRTSWRSHSVHVATPAVRTRTTRRHARSTRRRARRDEARVWPLTVDEATARSLLFWLISPMRACKSAGRWPSRCAARPRMGLPARPPTAPASRGSSATWRRASTRCSTSASRRCSTRTSSIILMAPPSSSPSSSSAHRGDGLALHRLWGCPRTTAHLVGRLLLGRLRLRLFLLLLLVDVEIEARSGGRRRRGCELSL